MKRPFLVCAVFYALFAYLTITFGYVFSSFTIPILLILLILSLLLFVITKRSALFFAFLMVSFSLISTIKTSVGDLDKSAFAKSLDGKYVEAEGRVESIGGNLNYSVITVSCDLIDGEKSDVNISVIYPKDSTADVGKRVKFKGELEYSFDSYGKGNETFLTTFVGSVEVNNPDNLFDKAICYLREKIRKAADTSSNSALATSLIIGDKTALPDDVTEDFSKLGISHLLAISGLHLSIVVMSLYLFLKRIGAGRSISVFLSILLTVFYMSVTGFSVSVVRAGQMTIIYLITKLIRRANDSISALFTAGFFIVLESSWSLFSISFQLSFLATLGILMFLPPATDAYDRLLHDRKIRRTIVHKILEYVIVSLYSTLSATLFTLPVILIVFNEVSVISPIANLFAVFFAKYYLMLAFIAVFLSFFSLTFLSSFCFSVADVFATVLFFFTRNLASIAPSSVGLDIGFLTFGAIILTLTFIPFLFFTRKIISLPLATVFVAVAFIVFSFLVDRATFDDLRVSAVYKRGCKTVYVSKGNDNALVDITSSDSHILSSLSSLVNERRVSEIDKAVFLIDKAVPNERITSILTLFDVKRAVLLLGSEFDGDLYEVYNACRELEVEVDVSYLFRYEVLDGVIATVMPDTALAVAIEKGGNTISFYRAFSKEDLYSVPLLSDTVFYDGAFPLNFGNTVYTSKDLPLSHWRLTENKIVKE